MTTQPNKAETNKKPNPKTGKSTNIPKTTDKKSHKLSSQTKKKKTKTLPTETEFEAPMSPEELEQAILAGFSVKKIATLEKTSDKKIPNRILLIFMFSLVLLLFAFYKIALQGFQLTELKNDDNSASKHELQLQYEEDKQDFTTNNDKETNTSDLTIEQIKAQGWEIIEIDTSSPDITTSPENEMQADLQIISSFYAAFGQVDVEGMNHYVDIGLKNTSVWQQFWSQKNINTFVGNVQDTLSLEDLFFIAGSVDELKKTRQYSYEISYILNSNQSFREDRVITLRDTPTGTKVAAIKCESNKCSSSPFFWPQNYGLK